MAKGRIKFPGGILIVRIAMIFLMGAIQGFSWPSVLLAQGSKAGGVRNKSDIAVWDFSLQGIGKNEGRAVTNRLRSELVNSGLFRVMSRDQVKKLLGEAELGQLLGDPREAIQAGKLKGVRFVVTGSLVLVMDAIQVTAELIDGQSAEILKSFTPRPFRGDFLDFLDSNVPYIAKQLAGVAESAAPPEVESGPIWERNLGYGFLAGALIAEVMAYNQSQKAIALAEESRRTLKTKKYKKAEDLQKQARNSQITALTLGSVGLMLLLDYYEKKNPRHFSELGGSWEGFAGVATRSDLNNSGQGVHLGARMRF